MAGFLACSRYGQEPAVIGGLVLQSRLCDLARDSKENRLEGLIFLRVMFG